jgi:uncharacterized protein YjbI with pentapeptide repeats
MTINTGPFQGRLRYILFLLLMLFITSCSVYNSGNSRGTDLSELEKEKLLLEIELAKKELNTFELEKIIGLAGGILGLVAILWTISQGYSTLKQQSDTQKALRIAELLSRISDKDEGVRIGAARGLSRYSDEVIDEVVSALSLEKSPQIRLAFEDVLASVNQVGFQKIININAETFPTRAYLLGRLSAIGATAEYSDALLRLSPYSRNLLKKEIGFQFDQGKNLQENENNRFVILNKSKASENLALTQIADQVCNTVEGTANIIARKLRRGEERLSNKVIQIDLALTNLYRVNLSKKELSGSSFFGCLMRHAILNQSNLSRSDLQDSNLYDASLYYTNFTDANLVNTHLRKAKGEKAIFIRANLEEAVLSNGQFSQTDFREVNAHKTKFRNTALQEAQFENAFLNQSEFQEANLKHANLNNAKCFGAKFIKTDFSDASLVNTKLGGADLRGAIFQSANLTNADLSGADISQADFRGAIIDNIILTKVKNKEKALFDDIKESN